MYYESQLRNLQRQAQLQRKLLTQVHLQRSILEDKKANQINPKRADIVRKQELSQKRNYMAKSKLQAELDASSVSTNAVLNRSRIESALEVRQKNQELNMEKQRSFISQQRSRIAALEAERQMLIETQRQLQLDTARQQRIKDDIYRKIRQQQEERIYYHLRSSEIQRNIYEEEIKREISRNTGIDPAYNFRSQYSFF